MVDLADLRVENDLYILKSGTELALSVAGALHALGAATLNPYPTVAMMRNKIIVTRMLKEAGVPTPDTIPTWRAIRATSGRSSSSVPSFSSPIAVRAAQASTSSENRRSATD